MDAYDRMIRRYHEKNPESGRTELSRRTADRQIAQRRMFGDLAPGQRSLNEPWVD